MVMRIAIVVGETSGDILGADLIENLRGFYPEAIFEGVGGPLMKALGFTSHYPMETLSVMGLEALAHLRPILSLRRALTRRYSESKPDIFIGIDAPDFNLSLEAKLKEQGVKTVHYVSPSVWAWRQYRVKKIKKSVNLMLVLLPFEAEFYQHHNIPVVFTGHPLADQIDLQSDSTFAKQQLQLDQSKQWVALLPGSRKGEVQRLGALFLQAAVLLKEKKQDLGFIIPAANKARSVQIKQLISEYPSLDIVLTEGKSRQVMQACDAILVASGTATLEAMLLKKPMVVSYRVSWLTYKIVTWLLKVSWVALPNLLANRELIPELLQKDARADKLCSALLKSLTIDEQENLKSEFTKLHSELRQNAGQKAANAIVQLLKH